MRNVLVDKGRLTVPLGGIIGDRYSSLPHGGIREHNEFVTYSDSQAAVRYLIKIHNPSSDRDRKRLARKRKIRQEKEMATPSKQFKGSLFG